MSQFDFSRQAVSQRENGQLNELQQMVIDLSVAREDELVSVAGSLLLADPNSTGIATIKVNNKVNPGFPFGARVKENIPFSRFYISNAAQAGKVLNLWYSMDGDIAMPAGDIQNIGSITTVQQVAQVVDPGKFYAEQNGSLVYFQSGSFTGAQSLWTAAQNTKGVRLNVMMLNPASTSSAIQIRQGDAGGFGSIIYLGASNVNSWLDFYIPKGISGQVYSSGGSGTSVTVAGVVL